MGLAACLLWLCTPLISLWEYGADEAEESAKAFVREFFAFLSRLLDDAGRGVLSVLDSNYAARRQTARRQQQAWQHFWKEDRTSTLNALVANAPQHGNLESYSSDGAGGSRGSGGGGQHSEASGRRSSFSRRYHADAGKAAERRWPLSGLLRRRGAANTAGAAGGNAADSAAPPSQPPLAVPTAAAAAAAAAAQHSRQQQEGVALAAPGRPGLPLSRQSWGQARRDYALRRAERAAAIEAAGWWGVHEALNRTGLLEDARLSLELAVTRAFEWLRWIVRSLAYWLGAGGEPWDAAASGAGGRPPARRVSGGGGAAGRAGDPRARRQGRRASGSPPPPLPPGAGCARSPPQQQLSDGDDSHEDSCAGGPEQGRGREGPRRGLAAKGGDARDGSEAGAPRPPAAGGPASRGPGRPRAKQRSRSFSGLETLADESHPGRPMTKLRRTRSVGRFDHTPWGMPWDDGAAGDEDWESPTAHVIRMAGYPLQTYTVVTEDGYILGMERIPRPGAPDVALFMHGILDTSLTWVSSGVTGSQAFAAWDQGFDVWLGSSRSNPPRAATNPEHQGMGYWQYTMNELGIYDVAAQVDKLHEVKLQELGGRDPRLDLRYAAGDPASAFRGAVSPVRRGAAATDGGTCFLLCGGAAASGRPAAPSGEALFSGSGVSAAPAPAAPRVVAPRGPLRMQRSYSDQALAPLGAPHGSSMPLAGGGSVAGDAAEAAAAAARLGRGGGADAGVAERRRRGLRAWLRSRSGKPAPAGREAGGVGAAAGVNGGDGVGGAAEEAKWAARAGGGRGGSKSRWPWSRQEQPQPLKDDDRRAHGAVRDDAGRKGVPTPPCQPGTPDASEHPPPSLGPAAARAGPRRAGGDQEGERPQRAWFNPGGQGAEDQPSRGGCAPPSPPASPFAGYAAQQAAATSAADGPAAPYAAATAAGATAADGVAVPALSVSSSLGSSGAGAGQDGGTPTPSSGAAGRAAVAAAPAAVPAAAAAAAAGGAEAPLSGIRRAQSSQAIFSLARSGPRSAGGSSSASLQQLLARGQAGGAPAPSAKAAAGSQGVVGSGALLGGATQAEEAGRAAPPAAGQQGAVGPSACVPRRAHGGGRDPYNLRVVAHSLGCASMLIYLVMRLRSGRPHHLQRLVLLSPAGFHAAVPWVFRPVLRMVPPFMFLMRMLLGARAAAALYIPTSAARLLTFKFMLDFARLPALGDLMRAFMRFSLNGDRSQWDRAMQLPHYNARAMPAVSFHQGLHFVQMYRSGRFRLYDYGSKAENMAHYGHPAPPDIASEYWRLDIPVDICAGVHDGVIPPKNVRCHVAAMRAAGVDVSYREFDYGHIDFTMATRDELRYWVLAKLGRR